MNIVILGSNGFVGSAVVRKLQKEHHLFCIPSHKNKYGDGSFQHTDFIINCAGISSRRQAEEDYSDCFYYEERIIDYVEKILKESPKAKVIHISSICAGDHTNYGGIKMSMENRIWDFDTFFAILRLGGLVGPKLIKNAVFDWIHGKPMRISPYSVMNFISTDEVAKIIEYIMNNFEIYCHKFDQLNVGASESIEIGEMFRLRKDIAPVFTEGNLPCEIYNIDISELKEFYPFNIKTSKEYIEEFLNELNL